MELKGEIPADGLRSSTPSSLIRRVAQQRFVRTATTEFGGWVILKNRTSGIKDVGFLEDKSCAAACPPANYANGTASPTGVIYPSSATFVGREADVATLQCHGGQTESL